MDMHGQTIIIIHLYISYIKIICDTQVVHVIPRILYSALETTKPYK